MLWQCMLSDKVQSWGELIVNANAGFQVGPTFPIFPTFPYFFDLLLLFPTFSWKCPTIPTFHSKMSFTRKNPEIFFSLASLARIL